MNNDEQNSHCNKVMIENYLKRHNPHIGIYYIDRFCLSLFIILISIIWSITFKYIILFIEDLKISRLQNLFIKYKLYMIEG